MFAGVQQRAAAPQHASNLTHHPIQVGRVMKDLSRMNRSEGFIFEGEFFAKLLRHADWQPGLLDNCADRAGADFRTRVRLERGDLPAVLCQRETCDTIPGAQIENLSATARAQQT